MTKKYTLNQFKKRKIAVCCKTQKEYDELIEKLEIDWSCQAINPQGKDTYISYDSFYEALINLDKEEYERLHYIIINPSQLCQN